jgi:hypothetical protein
VSDFFRPNSGRTRRTSCRSSCSSAAGPPRMRLVLAATLGASYGIYGPRSSCENNRASRQRGISRQREVPAAHVELDRPDSLHDLIARVNRIRRENPALQSNRGLRFHPIDNDRSSPTARHRDGTDSVLIIVNLDPTTRTGLGRARPAALGVARRSRSGARPALRRALPVARRAQLSSLDPATRRRTSSASAGACAPSTTSTTSCNAMADSLGTKTPSSTKCTCARSSTATTTASATSAACSQARLHPGPGRQYIWLLPFYPSPGKDDGYDIANYVTSTLSTARARISKPS